MKHKILSIAFLILLNILFIYICAIDSIPDNAVLFKGENLKIKTIAGLNLENENDSVLTSSSLENTKMTVGKNTVDVKLFDFFTVKKLDAYVIEKTKVIPVGKLAGLKIYTNGVLVVGMSEVRGLDNINYKPYENSGIKEGDVIFEINGENNLDTNKLINIVNKSNGNNLKIKYFRENKSFECEIKPVQTENNQYKLGLWVRDSAAGIGTMTYYEPRGKKFAALGHGITDIDTGNLMDISDGEFITTKILSIIKGEDGDPGRIQGTIDNQIKIGTISKNTNLGVYGILDNTNFTKKLDYSKELDVATKDEITTGQAEILCELDDSGPKEYSIEIEKIFLNNNYDNKSMLIKVTDKQLIEKTGGIVQGMSGCPIIQNGKFIGAITNVLVHSPTKGYAVFGDLMIKQMEQ